MIALHGTNEYVRAVGRCYCLNEEDFQPTPQSSYQTDLFGHLLIPLKSGARYVAYDPEEVGRVSSCSIRRIFRRKL